MLWTDCLTRLRQELSDNVFAMWIRPLVAEEVDGVMRLYAPNPYWTRYIQDNHLELISILAEQLSEGRIRQVEILVDSRPGTILSSSEQPATTTAALIPRLLQHVSRKSLIWSSQVKTQRKHQRKDSSTRNSLFHCLWKAVPTRWLRKPAARF